MTTVMPEQETDIFELLDFEFAPPCESKLKCDTAAEWKIVTGCCGHLWLLCTRCKDETIEMVKYVKIVQNLGLTCNACKSQNVPPDKFIFSVEPL